MDTRERFNRLCDIRSHLLGLELEHNKKWVEEYIAKIDRELDDIKNSSIYLRQGHYEEA